MQLDSLQENEEQSETQTPNIHVTRIYADENGESDLEEVDIPTNLLDFSPPAPAVPASKPEEVSHHLFLLLPVGWNSDGHHHPPARQIATILQGNPELTTSKGRTKKFNPGDIVLFEDTSGTGHIARNAGDDVVYLSVTQY